MSTSSSSNLWFAPLPILTGKEYNHWQKKMETFFMSQGLWNLIQNGITNESVEIEQRKDKQALYYIQQSVAPTIFPKIIAASSAKYAWDILEAEYNHQTNFVDDFHAIQIPEELGKSWPERCIHDIPKNLRDVNPTAYTPQLISIGPLHRARPELANMEKHKFYYAKNFLDRTQKQKVLFVNFIQEREQSIRGSYIKPSDLSSRDYVEMILLDSFFIFELFIRCQKKTDIEYADDSLLHELWYKNNLLLDLLLFENQLPFCLLSELYRFSFDNAKDPECFTFVHLCLTYFTVFNHKQIMLQEDECKKQLHFTGLVRRFNCREPDERKESKNSPSLKYAAKKLSESRVKFYGIHDGSLTDISFKKRVFKLPRFKIDNTTDRICRNLMGLEQHQFKDNAYICSYIMLLHLLMQTSDDVAVLVEDGVIVNGLDNNQAVVDLFNKLCKNITVRNFYFSGICEKLTEYRSSWKGWWNICRKVLKDGYFTDIWRGTGTVAAVILLLLTLVQTITSILQVKQGANS